MKNLRSTAICFFLGIFGFWTISSIAAFDTAMAQCVATVGQPSYSAQDELSLRAGISGDLDREVDLYFALSVPGLDTLLFLGPDLTFHPQPVPAISGWIPSVVPETSLVRFTLTGFEPEGNYMWAAAMFGAGSALTPENLVGDISISGFNFAAPAILDWFPHHGEALHTTEPDLSILFKKPVNQGSVVQHMDIKVESLSSGKVAEVKWINGERWIVLFIPEVGTLMQRVTNDEYIRPLWEDGGKRLILHVSSYTLYGSTYSLHFGGSYRLTLQMQEGATFADGTRISSRIIGPVDFSVAGP